MLKFITGNKGKFKEVVAILAPLKIRQVNIDLDEIQELDPHKIIRHKLNEAFKHHKENFIVEDTSTYYKAFKNKLPGPFMKWFLDVLGTKGLYELVKKLGENKTSMQTIIAFAKDKKHVYFFSGTTHGKIVKPKGKGKYSFGVDPIFQVNNQSKTLAELKQSGNFKFGARYKATKKLKEFLLKDEK